jgi:hypothetical protein
MLTYAELIELRNNLASNKIDVLFAKTLCYKDFKEGQRSWHTKDWKERRAKIIKDKCQICSSSETLTLQHQSHPKKYTDYEKEVTTTYTQNFINNNSNIDSVELYHYIQEKYDYFPIPVCPHCKSRNPNKRLRKVPQYLCTGCRCEFDHAVHLSVNDLIELFFRDNSALEVHDKCFVTKDNWKNNHNLSNITYWMIRDEAKYINKLAIEREALLNCLEDNIKYLSFEDTITACKKCASNYDLFQKELCPKCKLHYKGIQYSTCIQCLPEVERIKAIEKIEFARKMRDIE